MSLLLLFNQSGITYIETGLITAISRASGNDSERFADTGKAISIEALTAVTQWRGIDTMQATAISRANGSDLVHWFDTAKPVAILNASAFSSDNVFLVMPTLLRLINTGKTQVSINGN